MPPAATRPPAAPSYGSDPNARTAVAYVTNQLRDPADDNRGLEIIMAAYDGLTGLRA